MLSFLMLSYRVWRWIYFDIEWKLALKYNSINSWIWFLAEIEFCVRCFSQKSNIFNIHYHVNVLCRQLMNINKTDFQINTKRELKWLNSCKYSTDPFLELAKAINSTGIYIVGKIDGDVKKEKLVTKYICIALLDLLIFSPFHRNI